MDIDSMTQRFLSWPLPADVCADAVACKQGAPHRTGTNLLTHAQARQMIEHVCAAALAAKDAELAEMEARKDAAYLERNQCVALIATMAHALGHWAGIARTAIEGWSEDWHGCVYIDLPAGQVSWHYHDSQAYLFAHLPPYCGEWDGHDTPEKYRRVLQRPVSNARAERAEAEAAGLRADAGRWRAVSAMMTHEHRGDAVGWTLSVLLPGDDPDAAIDAARGE